MKWKLVVSISPLSAGISRRLRTASSSRSIVTFFGRRHCQINSSFYSQRFERSCRVMHSSMIEDDAYSELGPETSDCTAKKIKLVTEKPEHFVKIDPFGRELSGRSLSSDNRPRTKDTMSTLGRASPTSHTKLGGIGNASTFSGDTNKISDIESSHSISIKNILSTVGLYELVEAISIFGKVADASFVNGCNGLKSCNIKFESVDSSSRAILAGKIAVGNQVYPVHPLDAVGVISVRIKNISQKTSEYAIHSICKSVGELVGLARTSKDFVDAFFNIRNDTVHQNILKKLNSTVIDDCGWSAYALTSNSLDKGTRYKLGSQINDHLSEMRRQQFIQKINLEDLETLLSSIMHIEEHPPVTDLLR